MDKKRIVLDTNIYISALGWEGNARKVIDEAIERRYELIISIKQLNEIIRVMDYPKFGFTGEQKRRFLSILYSVSRIIRTGHAVEVIKEDPDDNIILEPAMEMKIDYIISGDKHLLRLKEFNGARVVDLQTFFR